MSSFDTVRDFRAHLDESADTPLRSGAPLAVSLGAVACILGFSLVGPFVSKSAADDAGIFSFLFGETRRAAPSPYRPYVSRGLAPQIDGVFTVRSRHAQAKSHRQKIARKPVRSIAVASHVVGPQQPVTAFTDTTLRSGDAVMTANGIRVFRGAHHFPFAKADFRPLAYAGKVSHRGALLAIDRVLRTPQWSAAWKPSSPLVELPHARRPIPAADTASRATDAPQRS